MRRWTLARPRRLTAGGTDHDHPVFAPDGRSIVFAAGRFRATDLYLTDRKGRFARRLTDGRGWKSQPCFSPDGTRLAYTVEAGAGEPGAGRAAAACDIVALDLASGSPPRPILGDGTTRFKQPAWSLDGRRLAYFSDEGSPGNFHLFLLDLEAGVRKQLTAERDRNDCHPAWSPDGRRLAFHGYEGLEADRANIYVVDLASGAVERATDRPGLSKHPDWADEETIVFHREEPGEASCLVAVDLARERETTLTDPALVEAKQPNAVRTRKGGLRIVYAARAAAYVWTGPLVDDDPGCTPAFDIWTAELARGRG